MAEDDLFKQNICAILLIPEPFEATINHAFIESIQTTAQCIAKQSSGEQSQKMLLPDIERLPEAGQSLELLTGWQYRGCINRGCAVVHPYPPGRIKFFKSESQLIHCLVAMCAVRVGAMLLQTLAQCQWCVGVDRFREWRNVRWWHLNCLTKDILKYPPAS